MNGHKQRLLVVPIGGVSPAEYFVTVLNRVKEMPCRAVIKAVEWMEGNWPGLKRKSRSRGNGKTDSFLR